MEGLETDTALLKELSAFTGKRPSAIAREAGLTPTTITRPFKGTAQTRLSQPTLEKLQAVWPDFPGWKKALPERNANVLQFEGASFERPRENLPVWGAALGCEREFEGEAVELTDLNSSNIIEYVKRPVMLNGRKDGCYALHVQGSSMHPALPEGEMVVAVRDMPLSIGDTVVVYLRPTGDEDDGERSRGVLVKELVRWTARYIELRQYQPAKDFRVEARDIVRIDRVLTRREMLS